MTDAIFAHGSVLRAYVRRRVRNAGDVDDYVQEVYARVLASRSNRTVRSWRGFLLRAASNLLSDTLRRGRTRMRDNHMPLDDTVDLTDGRPSIDRILIAREEVQRLEHVLQSVDPLARSIFLMVRVDGLTHREVAEQLGLGIKQVSRHVERVLARLARALAEESQP